MDAYAYRYLQRMSHLHLRILNFKEAGPMKIIAASNSPIRDKRFADYVCDGTDDQTEINAAVTALGSDGGMIVLLKGDFVAHDITLAPYVTFIGQGMRNGTTITLPSGSTTDMFAADAGSQFYGGGLRDLYLDGGGETADGVSFYKREYCNEFFIERCFIDNFDNGIYGAYNNGSPVGSADRFLTVRDSLVHNCTVGLRINGHPRLSNVDVRSCTTGMNGSFYDMPVDFCKFSYCTNGVACNGSGDNMYTTHFVNCSFFRNEQVGLEVQEHCLVDSCIFQGGEDGGGNVSVGIKVTGNAEGVKITNNAFGHVTNTTREMRGGCISLAADAGASRLEWSVISGNTFSLLNGNGIVATVDTSRSSIVGNSFLFRSANTGIISEDPEKLYGCSITGNIFHFQSADNATGIEIWDDVTGIGNTIIGNIFIADSSGCTGMTCMTGIFEKSIIIGNWNKNANTFLDASDNEDLVILGNYDTRGFKTEAHGSATITDNTTTEDVSHGLGLTPSIEDISVTPTSSLGAAAEFWISNVGASTFRINIDSDPDGSVTFAWQARIRSL